MCGEEIIKLDCRRASQYLRYIMLKGENCLSMYQQALVLSCCVRRMQGS